MIIRLKAPTIGIRRIANVVSTTLLGLLFFIVLFLPVSQDAFKLALIVLTCLALAAESLLGARKLRVHLSILAWSAFFVFVGLGFVALGLMNDAPGALFSALIYVIWPIVYIGFVARLWYPEVLRGALRICVVATIAIGLTVANQLLYDRGLIPDALRLVVTQDQAIVYYEGYTQMRLYAISSLVYLLPFLIAALMVSSGREGGFISRKWLWLALAMGTASLILSGRRAGMINLAIAPILTVIFVRWLPGARRWRLTRRGLRAILGLLIVTGGILMLLSTLTGWRIDDQLQVIANSLNSSAETERFDQLPALLGGWLERPIFGWGLGSVAEPVIRNSERPWQYELQYALALFHTGLVGLLAYAAGIVWLYLQFYAMVRTDDVLGRMAIPVFVGMTCFLIANGTNPYLQAYGHLWTLFLSIAFLNAYLIRRGARRSSFGGASDLRPEQ